MTGPDPDPFAPFTATTAVDLTAFLGTWPWRVRLTAGAAELGRYADRFALAAVCVSHLGSVFGFDTWSGNEALLDAVAVDERLLPFGVLDPNQPDVLAELDRLAANGIHGVRLFPGYHGYGLSTGPARKLMEAVHAHGLPLQICARLDDERLRHPRFRADDVPVHELAEAVRASQGRQLILSGLRAAEWDAVRAHLNSGDDISGVVADLWFVNGPVGVIRSLCEAGHARHLAFGSATPVQTAAATAFQLAAAQICAEDRMLLCRGNAERVLGGRIPMSTTTGRDAPSRRPSRTRPASGRRRPGAIS